MNDQPQEPKLKGDSTMDATGFVGRELSRIEAALMSTEPSTSRWRELFAAQQALRWATEPQGFAAPFDSIMGIFREDFTAGQEPAV